MTADACATPGCGHAEVRHGYHSLTTQHLAGSVKGCREDGCLCTAYLPPRPVPEDPMPLLCRRCGIRPAFDMTGLQCVECTQLFGQLDAPATVPAPHTEAEAAWEEFFRLHHNSLRLTVEELRREAFIAGFERGRGDRG